MTPSARRASITDRRCQVLPAVSLDDSVLLCEYRWIDALTRDYGVVCHTAAKAYHTVNGRPRPCLSCPTSRSWPRSSSVAWPAARSSSRRRRHRSSCAPRRRSSRRSVGLDDRRRQAPRQVPAPALRAGRRRRPAARRQSDARRPLLDHPPPASGSGRGPGCASGMDDGEDLRYVDREMLGKLYLVEPDGLDEIPGWSEMGPDADDPALTLDAFRQRIRRHPGELKPLLRNPRFVAGIGNAYSDEILWEARLAPFRTPEHAVRRRCRAAVHGMRERPGRCDRAGCATSCRPRSRPSTASSSRSICAAASRARAAAASCARSAGARRRRSAGPASRRL